jgi:hypothetical protein
MKNPTRKYQKPPYPNRYNSGKTTKKKTRDLKLAPNPKTYSQKIATIAVKEMDKKK